MLIKHEIHFEISADYGRLRQLGVSRGDEVRIAKYAQMPIKWVFWGAEYDVRVQNVGRVRRIAADPEVAVVVARSTCPGFGTPGILLPIAAPQ